MGKLVTGGEPVLVEKPNSLVNGDIGTETHNANSRTKMSLYLECFISGSGRSTVLRNGTQLNIS